ncbi:hypothetical protein DF186_15365, partial [Enterococcus hirae]
RIAELREELSEAERRQDEPIAETRLAEDPVDEVLPEPETPAPTRDVVEPPAPLVDPDPLPSVVAPSPPLTEPDDDSDYDKAIRRFRRRA